MVPEGLGTALKPAYEPIIVARKPISEKNIAANVLAHGTGALNIDACRIGTTDNTSRPPGKPEAQGWGLHKRTELSESHAAGRWPANVVLDEDAAEALDAQSGVSTSKRSRRGDLADHRGDNYNAANGRRIAGSDYERGHDDTGGASRFFYVAKASRKERGEGNNHPTVKPLALMRYLITLVTPPGGVILDPFAGSGSTLVAAARLGINAIGIELSEEYAEIAARRIDHALNERAAAVVQPSLLEGVAD